MTRNIDQTRGKKKSVAKKNRAYVGPWFRVYAEDLNNANLQILPDEVQLAWLRLCMLACRTSGRLPGHSQIAFILRRSAMATEALVSELIDAGLVVQKWDAGSSPYLEMASWHERQYVSDFSTHRVRKFRSKNDDETFQKRECNVQRNEKSVFYSERSEEQGGTGEEALSRKGSDEVVTDGYGEDLA